MSIIYEDDNGILQATRKRSGLFESQMMYEKKMANLYQGKTEARTIFDTDETIKEHTRELALALVSDRKLSRWQKRDLVNYVDEVVASLPKEYKVFDNIGKLNREVQSIVTEFLRRMNQ